MSKEILCNIMWKIGVKNEVENYLGTKLQINAWQLYVSRGYLFKQIRFFGQDLIHNQDQSEKIRIY